MQHKHYVSYHSIRANLGSDPLSRTIGTRINRTNPDRIHTIRLTWSTIGDRRALLLRQVATFQAVKPWVDRARHCGETLRGVSPLYLPPLNITSGEDACLTLGFLLRVPTLRFPYTCHQRHHSQPVSAYQRLLASVRQCL